MTAHDPSPLVLRANAFLERDLVLDGTTDYVVSPGGTVTEIAPPLGHGYDLATLQLHCDQAETVSATPIPFLGMLLVVDEDGWMKRGPIFNPTATALMHQPIVGTVAIIRVENWR